MRFWGELGLVDRVAVAEGIQSLYQEHAFYELKLTFNINEMGLQSKMLT